MPEKTSTRKRAVTTTFEAPFLSCPRQSCYGPRKIIRTIYRESGKISFTYDVCNHAVLQEDALREIKKVKKYDQQIMESATDEERRKIYREKYGVILRDDRHGPEADSA